MATKNDINRLFAEVIEYVKDLTTQNVVTTIQQNDNPSTLLSNVTKSINASVTQAYGNTASRMQNKLDEFEQVVTKNASTSSSKNNRTKTKK